jgi:hypothetical protein
MPLFFLRQHQHLKKQTNPNKLYSFGLQGVLQIVISTTLPKTSPSKVTVLHVAATQYSSLLCTEMLPSPSYSLDLRIDSDRIYLTILFSLFTE